jgi:hypothetical protein
MISFKCYWLTGDIPVQLVVSLFVLQLVLLLTKSACQKQHKLEQKADNLRQQHKLFIVFSAWHQCLKSQWAAVTLPLPHRLSLVLPCLNTWLHP